MDLTWVMLCLWGLRAVVVPRRMLSAVLEIRPYGCTGKAKSSGAVSEVSCRRLETEPSGAGSAYAGSAVMEGRRGAFPRCRRHGSLDGTTLGGAAGSGRRAARKARNTRGERAEAGFNSFVESHSVDRRFGGTLSTVRVESPSARVARVNLHLTSICVRHTVHTPLHLIHIIHLRTLCMLCMVHVFL